MFRDEIDFRAGTYHVDLRGLTRARFMLTRAAADRAPLDSGRNTVEFVISGRRQMTEILESHYASAGALADRLGLGPRVRNAVHHTFERWDGTGLPRGIPGDAIPMEMRVVQLADVAEVHWREYGADAAVAMARRRSGTQFDPEIVSVFYRYSGEILGDGRATTPGRRRSRRRRNRTGRSPRWNWTNSWWRWAISSISNPGSGTVIRAPSRHSPATPPGPSDCPRTTSLRLRRAAAVHDLGRLGVSNAIWDKSTPLSSAERERIRLYPYLTQRILGRVTGLDQVAALAGARTANSSMAADIRRASTRRSCRFPLGFSSAAERYRSLIESRPYRAALTTGQAAAAVDLEARDGALDPAAVSAVTAVAGHVPVRRQVRPSGLTPREEAALALAAVRRSSRDIAAVLVISEKTVRNHLEHIYTKAGVSNRAGASLFAVQHGIVSTTAGTER